MGMRHSRMVFAAGVSAALVLTGAWQFPAAASAAAAAAGSAARGQTGHPAAGAAAARPTVAYSRLALPGGAWARVYSDGVAEVYRTGDQGAEIEHVPLLNPAGGTSPAGKGRLELPARGQLTADLIHGRPAPFEAGKVVVVYRAGVTAKAAARVPASTLRGPDAVVPAYTSAPALNRTLAGLGVDSATRLFTGEGQLASQRAAAQQQLDKPVLNFADAAVLHLTGSSVATAVARLRSSADVAYAEPDWTVSTTDTPAMAVPKAALAAARTAAATRQMSRRATPASSGVPANYDLTSSAQSMLNRPGDDVVPAFTELARHGQLPGQGEIITNVSLGTLDDASAAASTTDPCNFYAANYGPTTIVQNGQRYLDWPSMPLIPTYTASSQAKLDPTGETCGDDPTLAEIGPRLLDDGAAAGQRAAGRHAGVRAD